MELVEIIRELKALERDYAFEVGWRSRTCPIAAIHHARGEGVMVGTGRIFTTLPIGEGEWRDLSLAEQFIVRTFDTANPYCATVGEFLDALRYQAEMTDNQELMEALDA